MKTDADSKLRKRQPHPPREYTRRVRMGCVGEKEYPMLRLRGKWLREVGFDFGNEVVVHVADGMLVIVPSSTIPEPEPTNEASVSDGRRKRKEPAIWRAP